MRVITYDIHDMKQKPKYKPDKANGNPNSYHQTETKIIEKVICQTEI